MTSFVNQERLYKERVIEFEKEIRGKIDSLAILEKEILLMGKMRHIWLDSVCSVDATETAVYHKKFNILKSRSEMLSNQLMSDMLRLESHYESQTLKLLIEATRPFDEDETPESRKATTNALTREHIEELRMALEYSIDFRKKLIAAAEDIVSEVNSVFIENETHYKSVLDSIREKIESFALDLSSKVEGIAQNHHRVTSDYLVLRHNAKIAREIVSKSQNEALEARHKLQSRLDSLIEESNHQRDLMERAALAELKFQTEDVRMEVIQKERELDEVTSRVNALKSQRSTNISGLKAELKDYKRRYKRLETERQQEMVAVRTELKKLKDMVSTLEGTLLMKVSRFE